MRKELKAKQMQIKPDDDSWIDNVLDVISKPTHTLNVYADKEGDTVKVKLEYDDCKALEIIEDVYTDHPRVLAFYDSFIDFIGEMPSNVNLQVKQTNCARYIKEILHEQRTNAVRVRQLLSYKNIKLSLEERRRPPHGDKKRTTRTKA